MPQMSPLNWLTLFLFFSLMYLIFASVMYYNTSNQQPKSTTNLIKNINLPWKW
uniref:ATP synthase complex subunit 8 n=1 Tax=Thermobia sp. XL-2019 TaxID=2682733 RepID=A0A6C0R281_9INSE|nr:ATP synthase F0 subunit 8 [Thermobia sp. XL-2019]